MIKNNIINFIDLISNIKWNLIFYLKKIMDKNFRLILSRNIELKNKHYGERCFIIGNGPSLKKMDLSKIHDEITFTVNNIMYNREIYNIINTDYHVLIDPNYFKLDQNNSEDASVIELIKSVKNSNKQPIFISSYEGFETFKKTEIANVLKIFYLYQHLNFHDKYSNKIDLTKNIPSSQNVIQAAIFVALFMGFKEIYLIGCDMTSIFISFEANENGEHIINKEFHAYKYNENEIKFMKKCIYDNEGMLYDYARTFTIFKNIRFYADYYNIKIFNATIGGGLDVFERVNYNSLFDNK